MLKPLKGQANFAEIFSSGKRFYEKDAVAIVCFRQKESVETEADKLLNIFYSVKINKRTEKKANVRNRIKRLMRVSINECYSELPEFSKNLIIEKFVVNWRFSPGKAGLIRLKDVKPVIKKLIIKINDYSTQLSGNR